MQKYVFGSFLTKSGWVKVNGKNLTEDSNVNFSAVNGIFS